MADNPALNYSDIGSGDVLVCIHGFLESSRMWDLLKTEPHIRKICIDLPGHGRSTLSSYSNMEDLARMVMFVLDQLQIPDYKVIGHSMGGYVGLELLRIDFRCQGLILLNSNTWSDEPQKQLDRERVAKLVMHSKKHFIYEAIPHLFWRPDAFTDQVENLIREASEMTPESIASAALAMSRRRDLTGFARQSGNRILIIQGEYDSIVPIERMKALELESHCDFCVIPNSGHMSLFEQPDAVQKLITVKLR